MLNSQDIIERIEEFRKIRPDAEGDSAKHLEVALFIEDVFGLCLSDDEICEKNLGTHHSTEQFVLKKFEAE